MKMALCFSASFFVLFSLIFSCVDPKSCPTNSDVLTWDSYGQWQMNNEGTDGFSGDWACQLTRDCGWSIFNNRSGGIGNTYQVIDPDSSVVFIWAYSALNGFKVTSNWQGQTKEGVKIGDSLSKFMKTYPYFTVYIDSSRCTWYGDSVDRNTIRTVEASFKNQKLEGIYVDNFR